jgi:hypothetical protein
MPLAARHTAISPMSAVGWAPATAPCWALSLAEVISNLVGEIGDKLGSLCQVASPDGIGLEGWWNAWEPGQRTWFGRRQRCEPPVDDGRHVVSGGSPRQPTARGPPALIRHQIA